MHIILSILLFVVATASAHALTGSDTIRSHIPTGGTGRLIVTGNNGDTVWALVTPVTPDSLDHSYLKVYDGLTPTLSDDSTEWSIHLPTPSSQYWIISADTSIAPMQVCPNSDHIVIECPCGGGGSGGPCQVSGSSENSDFTCISAGCTGDCVMIVNCGSIVRLGGGVIVSATTVVRNGAIYQ